MSILTRKCKRNWTDDMLDTTISIRIAVTEFTDTVHADLKARASYRETQAYKDELSDRLLGELKEQINLIKKDISC